MSSYQNTGLIHTQIDPKLKESAAKILKKLGISISDFIKLSFTQVVRDKSVQFELNLLSEDTAENYTRVKNMDHLKELICFKNEDQK